MLRNAKEHYGPVRRRVLETFSKLVEKEKISTNEIPDKIALAIKNPCF